MSRFKPGDRLRPTAKACRELRLNSDDYCVVVPPRWSRGGKGYQVWVSVEGMSPQVYDESWFNKHPKPPYPEGLTPQAVRGIEFALSLEDASIDVGAPRDVTAAKKWLSSITGKAIP